MIYEDRQSSAIEKKASKLIGKFFTVKDIDPSILQTFPYEYPKQPIDIQMVTTEFTCICPYSALPDFARLSIHYIPRNKCIELKSLKYYLYSFRQVKSFNEHVINKVLQDLVQCVKPLEMTITGEFEVRGGMKNTITASYPLNHHQQK